MESVIQVGDIRGGGKSRTEWWEAVQEWGDRESMSERTGREKPSRKNHKVVKFKKRSGSRGEAPKHKSRKKKKPESLHAEKESAAKRC